MAGTTVAFLFVDLVGSTELRHRLGDDANDELTRRYLGVLRDAVTRHGGTEVKSLGDGLMVAFPGALGDSVGCAVDMQRGIAGLNRRDPLLKLQMRVGLSAGEATCEADDWQGTPIVEAARLVAKALPGVILANDVMRVMVGSRGGFEFTPVGALELKGFPVPLSACEVGWEPDPGLLEVPLPSALDVPRGPPFVGRDHELAELEHGLDAIKEGTPRVVVVAGETGIGRHRLVGEFARRVHADGAATVLFGRCADDAALPAHGIVEALRWWAASVPPDVVRRAVGKDGGRLATLVPSLSARLPELIESAIVANSDARVEALAGMVARVALVTPLVLVLDATGGFDRQTADVVLRLVDGSIPLLVVVIAGGFDVLPAHTRIVGLPLAGLDAESTAIMLGAGIDVEAVERVRADSGGNPALILEAAGRLAESGALTVVEAAARAEAVRAAVGSVSPYKGLLRYEEGDADRFHGRDVEVAGLLARVAVARLVAVIGASGSGKSSLVRAGLLPALRRGSLAGSDEWPMVIFNAGRRPLAELATGLAGIVGRPLGEVLAELQSSRAGLNKVAAEWAAGTGADRVVVVVDQFEEIFTLCDDAAERERFVENLLHAVTVDDRVIVVLAMRADFFGHCAALPGLPGALESTAVLVGPMDESALREVIEAPAREAGLATDAGLADLMIRDVAGEPGSLPLLSHALYETWLRREHRTLTVAGYRACGGVRGAIAQTADTVVTSLGADGERLAAEIFVRLTELGEGSEDTRRRVSQAELTALGPQVGDVLEQLVAARLVTTDDTSVEVAHEALIREWPRLRGWLDSDRDRLRTLRQLTRAAVEWDARGRDGSDLYRGARLGAAIDAAADAHLTDTERSFLDASRETADAEQRAAEEHAAEQVRQNRRLRRRLAGVAVALVVALTASVFAITGTRRARVARNDADIARNDADLRSLVAESRALLDENRSTAMLLAVEAYDRRDDAASRDALLRAVVAEPRLRATFGPLGGVGDAGVLADGRRVIETHATRSVQVWDRVTGKMVRSIAVPGGRVSALAVSPDGERFALATPDGSLHVYSAASTYKRQGAPIATGMTLAPNAAWLAFSPDGRWIAVANGSAVDPGRVRTQDTVKLFRVADHRQGPPLSGHETNVNVLAFSADSATLATGATDNTVVLHDVATGTTRATIVTAITPWNLALDPLRPRLIVAEVQRGAIAYDIETGEPLASSTGLPDGVPFFDRAGNRLGFWGNDTVQFVNPASYEPIDPKSPPIRTRGGGVLSAASFLPDGEILFAGVFGPMTVWDAAGTSRLQDPVPGYPGGLSPTPDPHVLAGLDLGQSFTLLDAGTLQPLGPPIAVDPTEGPYSTIVVFDPSGKRLAAVGPSGALTIRTFPRGRLLHTAQIPIFSQSGAWRPDGRQIAFGAYNGGVTLVDPDTGDVRKVPRTGTNLVSWLAYRPDGRELWVSDLNGNVAVITRLDDATPTASKTERLGLALGVAFTADGHSLVAMRPGEVQVYDAVTLTPRAAPIALRAGYLMTLSADGRYAAVNDVSSHVRIVDLDAGRPIGPPLPIGALSGTSYTHDGKALLTSAPNRAGARWSIDPSRWRDEACALAGRNLTQAEWHRYLPNAGRRHATCPNNP